MSEGNGTPPVSAADAWRPAGSYRFWFSDQRWEWSDEVAVLHGYAPGSVVPTTELMLAHKHPEDRDAVADILAAAVSTGQPFCSRHRILDTHGRVRHVLVVGDEMRDADGRVVGSTGYYIDLTDRLDEARKEVLDETLPDLVATRSVIDQAKGALMLMYGISAEQAFRVLAWRSQETNTKLRDLAARLVEAVTEFGGCDVGERTRFDHLLLTAHERDTPEP
ncbi:PAS and ANTAR domain-containing protein [Nocardia farcinica]|uniref:PAS and ANTAR domain-containing protein n=1 Tax=Nocardia farcinica TaxID=37329 RepID=UPI001896118D|nr:PAS and ANTAR domain-containing protein [Nocardia farcinica]MBF6143277.1 PAS and ANTAR domain-containing protein [Nocardia farcinica]MBF6295729.1 PAS and ANTAR domain-containing protein [Nocardia farcinica]MBF6382237.1 PAS and ANTAR domain-containing protein [Nocardia farcinica]MBF6422277.1 PAS and ANTAR domain-containing protein [Nocardia farcinica]MBF6434003.1 PAS and ANTAR domain-containing protein [Nocardia farcinica]